MANSTDKSLIREQAMAARNKLNAADKKKFDEMIRDNVAALPEYQECDTVLCYSSYNSEVDSYPLMKKAFEDGKALFCPKVVGRNMVFLRVYALEELQEGYKGIMEPVFSDAFTPTVGGKKSLCIIPCVGVDRSRNRVGYGGGFYDRFLGIHEVYLNTVALAYSCQVVDEVPAMDYDVKPQVIVTENEIIR